jgi:hypothetical protein
LLFEVYESLFEQFGDCLRYRGIKFDRNIRVAIIAGAGAGDIEMLARSSPFRF